MKSKLKNIVCLFTMMIIAFFSFSNNTKAVYINIDTPSFTIAKNLLPDSAVTFGGVTHSLDKFWFMYDEDNKNEHLYCIEPGGYLSNVTYKKVNKHEAKDFEDYFPENNCVEKSCINSSSKKKLLRYVLTYVKDLGSISDKKLSNKSNVYKAMAAQFLIWQIAEGEVKINSKGTGISYTNTKFYKAINAGTNKNNAVVKAIKTEYVRIINAVTGSFLTVPSKFSATSAAVGKAEPIALSYNSSTKRFETKITDAKFQYYNASKSQNGLTITKTDNSITIASSAAIDKTKAKQVKISIKNPNDKKAIAYFGKAGQKANGGIAEYQDLVTISGTTLDRYLKVYTPKYQLKIIKEAELDRKKLSGVEFYICSDSSCKNKLNGSKTIKTGSDGTATYDGIPAPGTYYVLEKESSVPAGYVADTKPKIVTITKEHVVGTTKYATFTIKNKSNVFNLTKHTVDENGKPILLDDGCGSGTYTGPEFEIRNEKGTTLNFEKIKDGEYKLLNTGTVTKLQTCNGKFKVYTIPKGTYTIEEIKPPKDLTLPSNPTQTFKIDGASKSIQLTNGFRGLEFQKKDEDGNLIDGGKFALQLKVNDIYRDMLLKDKGDGLYEYDSNLKDGNSDATYILETQNGHFFIEKLPPGEYRIVEKEAPDGYEAIAEKDSKAIITIDDKNKDDYDLVEMVNHKVNENGSEASAELIVTIITGRKVLNYALIISGLIILLVLAIVVRNKFKK